MIIVINYVHRRKYKWTNLVNRTHVDETKCKSHGELDYLIPDMLSPRGKRQSRRYVKASKKPWNLHSMKLPRQANQRHFSAFSHWLLVVVTRSLFFFFFLLLLLLLLLLVMLMVFEKVFSSHTWTPSGEAAETSLGKWSCRGGICISMTFQLGSRFGFFWGWGLSWFVFKHGIPQKNAEFAGWWFQIFFHVQPYLGKWSTLTSIFFKWVGSTTN